LLEVVELPLFQKGPQTMTGSLHSLVGDTPCSPSIQTSLSTGANSGASKKRAHRKLPGYLFHKASGQARVRIDGKDYYLGPYGSDESRIEYGKLIANQASGATVDPLRGTGSEASQGLAVSELVLSFMLHARKHYLKNNVETSEVDCFKLAANPLVVLYGTTPAREFGPLALKAVRQSMIDNKWARKSINRAVARIRHIFRWGVENELVDATTLSRLQAVSALLKGRTDAHDNPPRTAVSDDDLNAVRRDVSPLVRDLIDLQKLIGSRSGELLSLTGQSSIVLGKSGSRQSKATRTSITERLAHWLLDRRPR